MGLFDSIKAKADVNGDGRITKEDLDALKTPENQAKIDDLKAKADKSGDGKLGVDDLKGLNIKDVANDLKNTFFKK